MSKKVSTYFPSYRLRRQGNEIQMGNEVAFKYAAAYFTSKFPLFGATETQKVALHWASYKMPPVISVSHEAPTSPDHGPFHLDPLWYHKSHVPYAMAVAKLDCLGENVPRQIKIYFCDFESWNPDNKTMHRSKAVHIVPVT